MTQEPDKALDALDVLHTYARRDHSKYPRYNAEIDDLMRGVRDEIISLRAEVERLEDRLNEAQMLPWPKWAEDIRKKLVEYGYDAGPEEGWDIGECMDSWIDGCLENESAERDRLTAELESAREALKPFAAAWDYDDFSECDDDEPLVVDCTMSDLRHAAHTLEKKL